MTPEQIAASLRRDIIENVLAPGDALVQEELAQRYGVSRNPVREALRMLLADGLVEMRSGEGATVRRLNAHDVTELYDLRLAIEPLIAGDIINEARRRDIDALRALAVTMDETSETSIWIRTNFEFHSTLYQLSGRKRTESLLNSLLSAVQAYSTEHIERLGGRAQASAEHFQMIDAIAEGRPDDLAALFVQHLGSARARLLDHLGQESSLAHHDHSARAH